MNERHDDLQEIIDAALREMAAEEGDGFDPQACNLAEFAGGRGSPLPREDGQGTRVQGPAPREQREEGRAGRARRPHRPGGRPPAEGRHQLAGDIRAAARPGLRRRPHHGEDLYRRAPGPRAREEAAGGPRQGCRGQRFRTAPGEAYQMDWGFVAVERPAGSGRGSPASPWSATIAGAPTSSSSRTRARRTSSSGCCTRSRRRACRDRAHRQHEERGRPPRCRRPARLAGRLRRVHGRRRLPHQVVQAAPPLYEGQGGEARPLREGELPRGKVLYRP